ncbi:MAG TPA: prepilin-type N-terminal cleavage/methylation domain-containing protein [Bacillota bacterium]|jgi:type IV pilus assembly protein PilA|nr:prepilin-type N-terminal cleavage/methylation domain-containing protein [Fastidiosipila sp.]HPX93464.1 prepilin-type N-terminal cleavage/methylation domain-containing protein [Bacillota bacterium]HQB81235.1 prepilin-type N-terminal cleavage/methylation domain-containing protein [Bacillota bacterium]
MKGLQKKRKGFTLVELVVVIVIIAILAAVALLSFGDFTKTARDSRIRSEHAQLVSAGNMWRAANAHDPDAGVPDIYDLLEFMDTHKPILGYEYNETTDKWGEKGADRPHTIDEHGMLKSVTSDDNEVLEYSFEAVTP